MITKYISIAPHDPLIARDGRPFSFGNRMKSLGWLYPSVVAGSLRTMLGKMRYGLKFEKAEVDSLKKVSVHGPIPLFQGALYFPAPKDLLVKEDRIGRKLVRETHVYPIRPVEISWNIGEGCNLPILSQKDRSSLTLTEVQALRESQKLLPSTISEEADEDFKPADIPAFWSLEMMVDWLSNPTGAGFPSPPGPKKISDFKSYLPKPPEDLRVHVKIDPKTGVAEDSHLFQTVGLDFSLKGQMDTVKLAARVGSEDDSCEELLEHISNLDTLHPIGGERRLAHWRSLQEIKGWSIPERLEKAMNNCPAKKKLRMVLATPAIFSKGWLPGWLEEGRPEGAPEGVKLRLVGACTERWRPISGWSLERYDTETKQRKKPGPKSIRRLVPTGSVYFFELDEGNAIDVARSLWLRSVCDDPQDRRDGFGLALWGLWDHHEVKKHDNI